MSFSFFRSIYLDCFQISSSLRKDRTTFIPSESDSAISRSSCLKRDRATLIPSEKPTLDFDQPSSDEIKVPIQSEKLD